MQVKVNAPQTAIVSNWDEYMARKRAEANKRLIPSDAFEYAGKLDWRDGDNASHCYFIIWGVYASH